VILAILAIASLTALAAYALGRRHPLHGPAVRLLRALWWIGAPASGVVATRTHFTAGLGIGLAAGWAVLMASLAVVLWATRRQPDGRRAETMLAVCWPNAGWLGFPAVVLVFGWGALPLAIAFSQLCTGPFTQIVVPGTAAALMHERGELGARVRAFLRNPYLACVGGGYVAGALGLAMPDVPYAAGRTVLLAMPVPAFAAVGAALAAHALRPDVGTLRLTAGRLAIAAVPLLALRQLLPIPAPFVLQAGMAVGMSSFQVAATYRVPTARLAPTLALSTLVVVAGVVLVPALR
jgi:predicted permease